MNFFETNQAIIDIIQNNKPASVLRIDNTQGYVFECFYRGVMPSQEFFNPYTFLQCGYYPANVDWFKTKLIPVVEQTMHDCDILGFVDMDGTIQKSDYVKTFNVDKTFFGENFLVMDPGALLGHSNFGNLNDPWTKYLKSKKVLVVSSHKDSILKQWDIIDKVWEHNKDTIAPFDLVDVVRSPFHPDMDDRQPEDTTDFLHSVDCIKKLIDSYDYDILLAGNSTSAPIYADHAKRNGKIGIQTGATIQLFFGIFGYRWTQVEGYKKWHEMFNNNWIYPLETDEPKNRKKYLHLETNFAYWST